jgi:hypothetical protein
MSGYLHFNRKVRLGAWAELTEATPEEVKAVEARVTPIEDDMSGKKYQETTLDRELEVVRLELLQGHSFAVCKSEGERSAVYVANEMKKMLEEWKQQRQLQEQQNSHIATMTSMVAQAVPSLATSSGHMTVKELAAALGCSGANVHRMHKAGTIRDDLVVPGTDRKNAHRKFHRAETEKWINEYLADEKKKRSKLGKRKGRK